MPLGVYPSSRAAFMTRARMRGDALAPGLKQRETADCETRARFATSYEVTGCWSCGSGVDAAPTPRFRARVLGAVTLTL